MIISSKEIFFNSTNNYPKTNLTSYEAFYKIFPFDLLLDADNTALLGRV